jgi:hypothetical protein
MYRWAQWALKPVFPTSRYQLDECVEERGWSQWKTIDGSELPILAG